MSAVPGGKSTQDLLNEACAEQMRLREQVLKAQGDAAAAREELAVVRASAGRELRWLRRRVGALERVVRVKHARLQAVGEEQR